MKKLQFEALTRDKQLWHIFRLLGGGEAAAGEEEVDALPVDVVSGKAGGRHITGGDDAIEGPFSALQFLEEGAPHGDMEGPFSDGSVSNVIGISGNSFPAGVILYGTFQIAKLDTGRAIAYYA